MSKTYKGKNVTLALILSFVLVHIFFVAIPTYAQTAADPISKSVPVPLLGQVPGTPGANGTVNNKNVLDTVVGSKKQCQFVDKGLYKPFSNISTDFALFNAFNIQNTPAGCLKVQGGMDSFILLLFKVVIGFCSVLAVIYIAIAGILMIVEQANIQKKIKAKAMLLRAGQGLLLSLVAWILLFTINKRLVQFSVDAVFNATGLQTTIAAGLQTSANANFDIVKAANGVSAFLATPVNGPQPGQGQGYGVLAPGGGTAGANQYAGTQDSNGAIVTEATIFGYRDGDGRTGSFGDNGIGGPAVSHVSGRTNYTGDTRSVGVAVPPSWISRDFGGYSVAKNSAYAIYQNGIHKGNFPIVDVSQSKLDLTYGLVTANFQANLARNKSNTDWLWESGIISYKPLPNFWLSNARPANPMIKLGNIMGTSKDGYGSHEIGAVLPSDIENALQNGTTNITME